MTYDVVPGTKAAISFNVPDQKSGKVLGYDNFMVLRLQDAFVSMFTWFCIDFFYVLSQNLEVIHLIKDFLTKR